MSDAEYDQIVLRDLRQKLSEVTAERDRVQSLLLEPS